MDVFDFDWRLEFSTNNLVYYYNFSLLISQELFVV